MIKKIKYLILSICISLCSCNLCSSEIIPYFIDGEFVMEDSSVYSIAGMNFDFTNRSEKNVKSFTLVFFMFDEDGNPPSFGRNNIAVTVTAQVNSGENLKGCVCLDSFMNEIPEEPYTLDFLYVSNIRYEDDSIWSDPFGLSAF